jgi:hypothetical protein
MIEHTSMVLCNLNEDHIHTFCSFCMNDSDCIFQSIGKISQIQFMGSTCHKLSKLQRKGSRLDLPAMKKNMMKAGLLQTLTISNLTFVSSLWLTD